MSSSRLRGGFSLIELMIVVSIIGILGVIAVSTLGDSEVEAMESQVVSNVRAISAAQLVYRSSHGSYAKAGSTTVDGLIKDGLIDGAWNQDTTKNLDDPNSVKRGAFKYKMLLGGTGNNAYAVTATPDEGSPRGYAMTKDGVIYFTTTLADIAAVGATFTGGGNWKILE